MDYLGKISSCNEKLRNLDSTSLFYRYKLRYIIYLADRIIKQMEKDPAIGNEDIEIMREGNNRLRDILKNYRA